ncbi:MAG TPA: IS481 family transposase [Terriglobales bacterium]|nr:IS481 family transposase [Terriglobales bacterium]
MPPKTLSAEALLDLRRRLNALPPQSAERRRLVRETAALFGVSEYTLYRKLRAGGQLHPAHRKDRGVPKVLPEAELVRYCELVAAIKLRTSNRKGRHLSTAGAIRLLEDYGLDTPDGFTRAPKGVLTKPTVNRYLKHWGLDRQRLTREPPAVRFQARHSNALWQFDLSPSDLKHIEKPGWVDATRGPPTLMLFSVVDDRSGAAYQEYRCTYGEEAEAALRFLFNAMAPKSGERLPVYGRPLALYLDPGPVSRSAIFQRVMRLLDIEVITHLPSGKDGRRTTARSKGKVERPFRSVKELHETLYHFHKPGTEEEANAWLFNFLLRYNDMPHRSEPHSRIEDWMKHLPPEGLREMCDWGRFCTFAREPESRKVGGDARVTVDGVAYEVGPDLAGETVTLWFGLFDDEIFVEYGERRYGPYRPVSGPIPLHRYRRFRKTATEKRADRIEALASRLALPRAALSDRPKLSGTWQAFEPPTQPFRDPDPFHQLAFPSVLDAKRAIADHLGIALAKLPPAQLEALNALLLTTLAKQAVFDHVRRHIEPMLGR